MLNNITSYENTNMGLFPFNRVIALHINQILLSNLKTLTQYLQSSIIFNIFDVFINQSDFSPTPCAVITYEYLTLKQINR